MAKEKPKIKRDVHGHSVLGDKETKEGLNHLDYDLDYNEAEVFFKQARMYGQADFEDEKGRNFTLVYNRDGTYTVVKRKSAGGWF